MIFGDFDLVTNYNVLLQRHARHDDELVARCYFSRKTLAWEILDGHLKFKFEILFSDIDAIKSYIIQDKGFLIIRLKNRPTFFREGKSKPRKHTKWEKCTDFTNQVATKTRVHELEFTRRVLEKHYSNIVQSNSDLFKLSTVEFPHHESHFFDDVRPKPYINQIGLQTEFPSNFRVPQQPLPVQGHLIYDGTKFSLPCTTSGSSFQDHNIGNFADDGYRGTNDIDSFTVDQGGSRYFRDHTGRLFGIPSSASSLSRLNDEWPPLTYPQVNPPTAMNHAMIPCAASARQRWLNEYTYTSSIPRSVTSPMSILNNGDFQTQTQNQNQNQTVLRNMQQNGHSNNEQRNQRANNQDGATNHAMIPSTAGAQHHCWMNGHTYDTSIPRFDISPTMPVLNNMDIQTQTQTQTRDHDRLLEDDSAVTSVDGRRLRLRNMQQNGHINSNQQQNQRPN
ncbi:hypothetical protein RND81_09G237600 [Saponaria officinalis]|uniref:TRF2/HOY1 PH-like domain-containing protein n=1 Tax=Saponaria officinalis TaxID=3572 RepID=A0AAW1IQW0_SAPOF